MFFLQSSGNKDSWVFNIKVDLYYIYILLMNPFSRQFPGIFRVDSSVLLNDKEPVFQKLSEKRGAMKDLLKSFWKLQLRMR